jgi:hypothetical protein
MDWHERAKGSGGLLLVEPDLTSETVMGGRRLLVVAFQHQW